MNLKKLVIVEGVIIVIAIVLIAVFVGITPYLTSSNQNDQIGVFNQRVYVQDTVTIQQGQNVASRFNYTSYDPAILVVDLNFKNWENSGSLLMYCNGILVATFNARPSDPSIESTAVTFSGFDLVKPPLPPKIGMSFQFTYGNEISFLSPMDAGYEGTFNYQISIRGSR